MNWKIVVIGGMAYYATMFVVSMATGYFIHSPEGVLFETYQATASFWRPELNADPPDMGALMPMWIATGLVSALIAAGIYSVVRSSLAGAPWERGLKFGVIAALFAVIVFVIGFIGSIVLKGVRTPGAGTLAVSLILALIFAALTFVPPITQAAAQFIPQLEILLWPLIGAAIGYFLKR